jgi:hypothetical protein
MAYAKGQVSLCIPTIPPRQQLLRQRLLASVERQTRKPDHTIIKTDWKKKGSGPTRTRALRSVTDEWVTFADDDDELYPQHVQRLMETAEETGADLVYPWFDVRIPDRSRRGFREGQSPFPQFEGKPWDPEHPHLFPICALVRTELAQQSEFPALPPPIIGPHGQPENPDWSGDDWPFWCDMFALGAKVVHLNERTWAYWHWGVSSTKTNGVGNTSGRPDRW